MSEHDILSLRSRFSRRGPLVLAGAALLAVGGAAGAMVMAETRPSVSLAPLRPVAIRSLSDNGIVTVRGRVAEVFGGKFVIEDGTGRALVDAGPDGEDRDLVAVNQMVTVQGRFQHGFVHAAFLVGADGKVTSLAPPPPPHGPHGGRGPDRDGAPPPPPAATGVALPAQTGATLPAANVAPPPAQGGATPAAATGNTAPAATPAR